MSRTQKYSLVVMLLLFWMGVIFAPVFAKGFQPPPEINAAIPALIGTILAAPTKGERRNSPDNQRVNEGSEEGE